MPRFNIIEGGETPYKPGVIEAVSVGGTLRVLSLKVGLRIGSAAELDMDGISAFSGAVARHENADGRL